MIGGLQYGKYCKIHLLHIKQIEILKELLDFRIQKPHHLINDVQK